MISRYNVSNLLEDLNRRLFGTGISLSQGIYSAIDGGRRTMFLNRIQPPELKRTVFIEQALYDRVDRYAVPADIQYSNIIDMKRVSSRRNLDTLMHPLEYVYQRRFAQKRWGAKNVVTINYDNGVKYLQVNNPRGMEHCKHVMVNKCESLDANGTWNMGGNLVNLTVDKINYVTGKASLKFDFDDSGIAGFLETSNMDAVNLQDIWETGSLLSWIELPRTGLVSTVNVRIGSSATDYYEFTASGPHDGTEFTTMWNLLAMELTAFSREGFPNQRELTYLRVSFTTDGTAMAGCHLDDIVARKGFLYEMNYESVYMFRDPQTQVFKLRASSPNDIIVAEEDTYQILLLETCKVIMAGAYDSNDNSTSSLNSLNAELAVAYAQYRLSHPSESVENFDTNYVFGDMYSGPMDEPMNGGGNDHGEYGNNSGTSYGNGGC